MPNHTRAATIINALQYINDPAQRAALEAELHDIRVREYASARGPESAEGRAFDRRQERNCQ